jgi:hypothetical protein
MKNADFCEGFTSQRTAFQQLPHICLSSRSVTCYVGPLVVMVPSVFNHCTTHGPKWGSPLGRANAGALLCVRSGEVDPGTQKVACDWWRPSPSRRQTEALRWPVGGESPRASGPSAGVFRAPGNLPVRSTARTLQHPIPIFNLETPTLMKSLSKL